MWRSAPTADRWRWSPVADRVAVVDVVDGVTTTVYRVSSGTKAPPLAAGWSPDGHWVLFFSEVPGQGGRAAQYRPGGRRRLGERVRSGLAVRRLPELVRPAPRTLRRRRCGRRAKVNQILVSGPPEWRYENLSNDFSRSWIWPACSPNGKWIVVTATPNVPESPPGRGIHALWLLSTDGTDRSRITGAGERGLRSGAMVGRRPVHPGGSAGHRAGLARRPPAPSVRPVHRHDHARPGSRGPDRSPLPARTDTPTGRTRVIGTGRGKQTLTSARP